MNQAAVVGAGVFGASTARELQRRGWRVSVHEQYGPGNVRSGSGGETRIIRCAHADADWYTLSALRALELWQQLEAETGERLFEPVGVAWFDSTDGDFTALSEDALRRLDIPCERLSPTEARRLFPSLGGDDLRSVLFEPAAGVLYARAATRAIARGLDVTLERVLPEEPPEADVVVWACGSWLPKTFPGLVEQRVSRRDVFFFGVDGRWANAPAFCDYDTPHYGHGDVDGLGMKLAPDTPGDEVDPDTLERLPLEKSEQLARTYLARRFPELAGAPLTAVGVCQYDLTRDNHFLVARHPERSDWWLVGGGSGHGFKHGPALAEYVADCVEGRREPEAFHGFGPRAGPASLRTATVEV